MKEPNQREIRTIRAMIAIYCRHHHGEKICEECSKLQDYAIARINKCIFGAAKPACKECIVHCYSPKMREKVKEVMRFAGPRMIWRHPVMAISHLVRESRPVPERKTNDYQPNKSKKYGKESV